MSEAALDTSKKTTVQPTHARTPLPNPLQGTRIDIVSIAGRIATYSAAPLVGAETATPLFLLHSINAAPSAFEVKPLFELYARKRPVFAIDLPGFGQSERPDREYNVRLMTDAVHAAVAQLRETNGGGPVDALALSLSCEFLARAAVERPEAFRSVAFISPTGFEGKPRDKREYGHRGKAWVIGALNFPLWRRGFFKLLTARPVMRKFLEKTWGSKQIDEAMLDYDYQTAHQRGARHAPYYFVGGYLFSTDILHVYDSLRLPVWMAHGVRGDFIDFRHKDRVAHKANWHLVTFDTGAFPHFEKLDQVAQSYDAFLAETEQRVTAT